MQRFQWFRRNGQSTGAPGAHAPARSKSYATTSVRHGASVGARSLGGREDEHAPLLDEDAVHAALVLVPEERALHPVHGDTEHIVAHAQRGTPGAVT